MTTDEDSRGNIVPSFLLDIQNESVYNIDIVNKRERIMTKLKKKISYKEVEHFIGHDPQDWITDCMYRLMNKKISVSDLRKEAKEMYKSYIKVNV